MDWYVTVGAVGPGEYNGQNLYGPMQRADAEEFYELVQEQLKMAQLEHGKKAFPYGEVTVDYAVGREVHRDALDRVAREAAKNWTYNEDLHGPDGTDI